MLNITSTEAYHIKNLLNCQSTLYKKLINFSDYAVDPQFKQTFNKAAQTTLSNKEKLLSFLT